MVSPFAPLARPPDDLCVHFERYAQEIRRGIGFAIRSPARFERVVELRHAALALAWQRIVFRWTNGIDPFKKPFWLGVACGRRTLRGRYVGRVRPEGAGRAPGSKPNHSPSRLPVEKPRPLSLARLERPIEPDDIVNPARAAAVLLDWSKWLHAQPARVRLVLRWLSSGLSYGRIADRLGMLYHHVRDIRNATLRHWLNYRRAAQE